MEKTYFVQALNNEIFQVELTNINDFTEKIEQTTGILSVCQEYYNSGRKILLNQIKNSNTNSLSVIDKKIPSCRFYISTPSTSLRICLENPEQKTIKNLVISFYLICQERNLNYPMTEYSFYYKNELLFFNHPLSQIPHDSLIHLINQPTYPQINPINLIISTLTGREIHVCLFGNYLVKNIKDEIMKLENITIDEQRLIFNQVQLDDERTIFDYNIQNESKLSLILRLRGGGGPVVFSFNEMSNQIKFGFSNNAPKWRIVDFGISFIGICKNRECCAYNHEVISNAGLGVFDIKRQVGIMPCPMCEQPIGNAKNCGFFMAEWSFFGIDSRGVEIRGGGEAYEHNYTTFLDGDDEQWQVLRIAVRQKRSFYF
ncbi:hypothetical protein SteCoe_35976 [Stentor coeruleus]|uniref:Ubiquitin-like domain-containing protein n=1 Tax=Stentor coeruleus TaxID=5963 RepID=A0A1R2AR32_9CILI|nr:hypothetical protein SteCoe_35976 [Stentor coeruleus]